MKNARFWLTILITLTLAGCASAPLEEEAPAAEPTRAQQDLLAGVAKYEEGKYADSAKLLQASLNAGLSEAGDQATAHKYLAFMHCAANRIAPCRDQFRAALKADPSFELSASEIGHPVWGPVYRAVKSGK
jgi:Tfp pilus assembly protein PilF